MSDGQNRVKESYRFKWYRFLARSVLYGKKREAVRLLFEQQWEGLSLERKPAINWRHFVARNLNVRSVQHQISKVVSIHQSTETAQVSLAGLAILDDERVRRIIGIMCELHVVFRERYIEDPDRQFTIFWIFHDLRKSGHRVEEILFALNFMRNWAGYISSSDQDFPYDWNGRTIVTQKPYKTPEEFLDFETTWNITVAENILDNESFFGVLEQNLKYTIPGWLSNPLASLKSIIARFLASLWTWICAVLWLLYEIFMRGIVEKIIG